MARILYAASGCGYGHAVRAHAVGKGLIERGHNVQFASSNKTVAYLTPHYPDRIHNVFGLLSVYVEGQTKLMQTLLHNLRRARSEMAPSNRAIKTLLRTFKPDLVITDFEPFTAFWARRFGIPFISLDNQHLLTHCEVDRPRGFVGDLLSAYLTIRLYYGGAKRYVVTSFIDAPVRFQPAKVVDPVIRREVYDRKPQEGNYLVVYQTGPDNRDMREQLDRFDRMPIRAYGFGKVGNGSHVTYRPFDQEGFLNDLVGCAGVVASAGHSLVSECLHLEKPMLLVPMQRQYEQILNAHHVKKMGVGATCDRLDARHLDEFVGQLDRYRSAIARRPKASQAAILDAVEQEIP